MLDPESENLFKFFHLTFYDMFKHENFTTWTSWYIEKLIYLSSTSAQWNEKQFWSHIL